MALPITVPFTFGNATTTQSLSSLDVDFSTVYNAVNGIGNGTVSLSNVSITGGSISANITASGIFSGTSNVSITSASGPVSINTNGTNAMYINASQNVGIGTTSPTTKLDVPTGNIQCGNDISIGRYNIGSSGAYLTRYSSDGSIGLITAQGSLIFGTSSTESARIDSSGNLLVGTTLNNLYAQTSGKGLCYRNGSSLDVLVTSDNAVILNRTGTDGGIVEFRKSSIAVGSISVTGSSTSYNVTSDYRLKNSIFPITAGLATISALNPVTYKWNVNHNGGEGFIAHELQTVIPHAVTGEKDAIGEDGNPIHQGVDYSKIVVHLVAAIQELSAKNDALEARLAALEAK